MIYSFYTWYQHQLIAGFSSSGYLPLDHTNDHVKNSNLSLGQTVQTFIGYGHKYCLDLDLDSGQAILRLFITLLILSTTVLLSIISHPKPILKD